MDVYMVNVYAPQRLSDKMCLWNSISNFMSSNSGDYILFGDWNSVREECERFGTDFSARDAHFFNDFIERSSLHEIILGGLKYTWRLKKGTKFSKLDHFFVSNNILSSIEDLKGEVLPRGFSDHSPIMLFQDKIDFGPTYFKVFDSWFERDDFEAKIHQSRSTEYIRLRDLKQNIHDLDLIIESGTASSAEIESRNSLFKEQEEIMRAKFEKVDSNIRFDPVDPIRKLSIDDANLIETEFEVVEIKKAVWDCGSSKAPGPDGYSFQFIKHFWDILQADIIRDVRNFFASSVMPIGANSAFFSLIPKVSNPVIVSDFRPISLVSFFYKIITKLLTNRLARVIDKIISPEQSAFIAGRQILDGPLMLSEILSWWIGWIKGCLFSARTSVLVNGNPTREFSIKSFEVDSFAAEVVCQSGSFPTTYLGIPIGLNMKRKLSWSSLIDKFHSKMAPWKVNLLSSGGRLTLIKSVMGSLGSWSWSWSRSVLTGRNASSFSSIQCELQDISLSDAEDRWVCSITPDDVYSVKCARNYMDRVMLPSSPIRTVWNKIIPRKRLAKERFLIQIILWPLKKNNDDDKIYKFLDTDEDWDAVKNKAITANEPIKVHLLFIDYDYCPPRESSDEEGWVSDDTIDKRY
ncbi:uncharacterized protein [Rutidosis leptorrhynchoides]|uniref:uncharacterized protein n=1 Tax=Rutidosis leptorrhynchoides TaxID=125765 RepID=UPI003A999B20